MKALFSLFRQKSRSEKTNRRKRNRGVSLAEAVVAMAVIAIVSISAIAAVQNANNALIRDVSATQVRTDASNSMEFFKFCDDMGTLRSKILAYTGTTVQNTTEAESGNVTESYASTVGTYNLRIEVVFEPAYQTDGTKLDYGNSTPISIRTYATDKNGNLFFDVGYQK